MPLDATKLTTSGKKTTSGSTKTAFSLVQYNIELTCPDGLILLMVDKHIAVLGMEESHVQIYCTTLYEVEYL